MDHVLFAGSTLETMEEVFADFGLETEYGGEHDNGVTHNSLVGFDDGTYLELITTVSPDVEDDVRGEFITGDAGPCGWAVEPEDIEFVADRAERRGFATQSPFAMNRETPKGDLAAWKIASFGEGVPGTKIPFLITDTEPREHRITPSESVAGSELTGVGGVALAVNELDTAVEQFERAFDLPAPQFQAEESLGAKLAHFPGTPVFLAAPEGDGRIADRLAAFGETPYAFLLATAEMDESLDRRPLHRETEWFGHRVAWFDIPQFDGEVGVIG